MDFSEIYKNSNLFSSKSSGQEYILVAFIVVVAIIIILVTWAIYTLNKQFRGCSTLYEHESYNKPQDMPNPDPSKPDDFNDQLKSLPRNFYIKTAYNACCGDNYKNTFVNLCALDNCILKGARCLDFQIYSYNNKPIIAASTVNNNYIKETYNHLLTDDVLKHIKLKCFDNRDSKDPLYLHFRIMSNNKDMYDILADEIIDTFGDTHLLNSENELAINGASSNKLINDTIINSPYFEEKVIIIVNAQNNLLVENSRLAECVNLYSGSQYFNLIRYNELFSKGESNSIQIEECKNKFVMVLPDLDTNKSNFDIILPISNGCQFIAMKFQTHDENLISYLDYFKNDNNTYFSFKLKSEKLRLDNQNPSTIDGGTVLSEPLLDCFHLDTTTGDNQNKCEKAKVLQEYITKNDKDIVVAELDTILSEATNAGCDENILSAGRNRFKVFIEEYTNIIHSIFDSWSNVLKPIQSALVEGQQIQVAPPIVIGLDTNEHPKRTIDKITIWDLTALGGDKKITDEQKKIFKKDICNLIKVKESYTGRNTLESVSRQEDMLRYLIKKCTSARVENEQNAEALVVKIFTSIVIYLHITDNFTFDSCP